MMQTRPLDSNLKRAKLVFDDPDLKGVQASEITALTPLSAAFFFGRVRRLVN